MGFLSGFGTGLARSAELEQQAQIVKKQELIKLNMDLAKLYLASPNEEDHATAFAIMSDPTKPHRTDKPHPNLQEGKNIAQALGSGKGAQAVASGESPAGMVGMLSPSNSPLVQNGVGAIGDQGSGEPIGEPPSTVGVPPPIAPGVPAQAPPAPPLPPQPAAMTTNPPATQGGKISPAAVGTAPPTPPPAVAAALPAPPPPAPFPDVNAMIASYAGSLQQPTGISADAFKEQRTRSDILARARALKAGGASDEEIIALIGGHDVTSRGNAATRAESTATEGAANRESREHLSQLRLEAMQKQVEARIAESKARREQDWAKHRENLSLAQQRLAKSGTGANAKAEAARIGKLQDKGREITNYADNGIAGVENLRGMYQLFQDAKASGDRVEAGVAWKRFSDAAGGEATRIASAMNGMGVKGVRMDRSRVEAAIKEITTTGKDTWMGALGYPPVPTLRPEEVNLRLDNIRHLVEQSEDMARKAIEADALNPPKAGTSPFSPVPERARAGEKPPEAPAEVKGAAPKIGDTKTFPNGRKASYKNGPQGPGWYASQ